MQDGLDSTKNVHSEQGRSPFGCGFSLQERLHTNWQAASGEPRGLGLVLVPDSTQPWRLPRFCCFSPLGHQQRGRAAAPRALGICGPPAAPHQQALSTCNMPARISKCKKQSQKERCDLSRLAPIIHYSCMLKISDGTWLDHGPKPAVACLSSNSSL